MRVLITYEGEAQHLVEVEVVDRERRHIVLFVVVLLLLGMLV